MADAQPSVEEKKSQCAGLPKPGSPCWLQIPVTSMDRGKSFWGNVFGWTFSTPPPGACAPGEELDFALFNSMNPGTSLSGALRKKEVVCGAGSAGKEDIPLLYLYVLDVDETLAKVVKEGGKVVTAKGPQGTMGEMATFQDFDGNVFGIWTEKKRA